MKNETTKLQARIASLEAELAAAIKKMGTLEKDLAAAYENGQDTTKALRALGDHKDSISAMVGGLRGLDQRLFTVQSDENECLARELDERTHREFEEAARAVATSLTPVRKAIGKFIAKDRLDGTMNRILEQAETAIWPEFQEKASREYLETVPAPPASVIPRDDHGRRFSEIEMFDAVRRGEV